MQSDHSPLCLGLQWGRPISPIPTCRLRVEALSDSAFRDTLADHITRYFEANTGTSSNRAIEWDAHKATIRGHCINTIWGVKMTLQRELAQKERALREKERIEYTDSDMYDQVVSARAAYVKTEQTLAKFDFKHYTAKLHKEGDRSGRMLALLSREDRDRRPIGAIYTFEERFITHKGK